MPRPYSNSIRNCFRKRAAQARLLCDALYTAIARAPAGPRRMDYAEPNL